MRGPTASFSLKACWHPAGRDGVWAWTRGRKVFPLGGGGCRWVPGLQFLDGPFASLNILLFVSLVLLFLALNIPYFDSFLFSYVNFKDTHKQTKDFMEALILIIFLNPPTGHGPCSPSTAHTPSSFLQGF